MANKDCFHAIGLMSGTSLDGLDICYARFEQASSNWDFEILHAETVSYSKVWEQRLSEATLLSAPDLFQLSSDYGFFIGELTQAFIKRYSIYNVDVIGSHGHTVFHQPQNKLTVQIGDGRAIQIKTHTDVVYDFRMNDVLLGGNGAPLVPIGDELLFSDKEACINLGGFSNISLKKEGKRIGYDICPVNIILNRLAKRMNKEYDEDGKLAQRGSVNHELVKQLNRLEFYQKQPPKSLGYEWLETTIFPLLEGPYSDIERIASFTEHAADQIASQLNQHQIGSALLTGGGSHNTHLIQRIKAKTKSQIIIPAREIIDYKEALIFAFMAVLKKTKQINVLSSVTGAQRDHSSGIFLEN